MLKYILEKLIVPEKTINNLGEVSLTNRHASKFWKKIVAFDKLGILMSKRRAKMNAEYLLEKPTVFYQNI